jgi:hypothetical protein
MSMNIATPESLIPLKLNQPRIRNVFHHGCRISGMRSLFSFIAPKRLMSHPVLTPVDFTHYTPEDKQHAENFKKTFFSFTDLAHIGTSVV